MTTRTAISPPRSTIATLLDAVIAHAVRESMPCSEVTITGAYRRHVQKEFPIRSAAHVPQSSSGASEATLTGIAVRFQSPIFRQASDLRRHEDERFGRGHWRVTKRSGIRGDRRRARNVG